MLHLKTLEEIKLIHESAQLVSKTLGMLAKEVKPGVTTLHLDSLAEEFIRDHGAIPGFLGLYDFPNSLCISVDDCVVHGLPSSTPLENGSIISVDCGVLKNDFYGDHAYTFEVGEVEAPVKQLLLHTKESLYVGIRALKQGNRIGDVGNAIQKYCESKGYGVVRELVGHGLGREMHEAPEMPNYGRRGHGKKIQEGMVVALEPMINLGKRHVKHLDDGWSIVTKDGKPSAHFEHNIAIHNGEPLLLSTFKYVYEALGIESSEEDEFKKL